MSQKSKTARMIEYGELSKDFDFRDDIESALENDYAENPNLYSLEVLKHIKLTLVLAPELPPQFILELVKSFREYEPDVQTGPDELIIPGSVF